MLSLEPGRRRRNLGSVCLTAKVILGSMHQACSVRARVTT